MKDLYIDSRYSQGTSTTFSVTGSTTTFTVSSTLGFTINQPVTMTTVSGSTLSGTYYIGTVLSSTTFQLVTTTGIGSALVSSTGSYTMVTSMISHNSYTLFLQRPIKNIRMAQVLQLTVNPVYSQISTYMDLVNPNIQRGDFIFLDIVELRRPYPLDCKFPAVTSNLTSVSTAFGMVQLRDVCTTTPGNFYSDKKDHIMVEYPKPIDSVDRLTVRWIDYQGNPVPMGSYNMFSLRIDCEEN